MHLLYAFVFVVLTSQVQSRKVYPKKLVSDNRRYGSYQPPKYYHSERKPVKKIFRPYPVLATEKYGSVQSYRPATTERPRPKEVRKVQKAPKKWAAPVSNAIEESPSTSSFTSSSNGESFPSFGGEKPRNGKIRNGPGDWATPAPDSGINLDFVPVQTYLQVRQTNQVKHVPQSEAFKDATSYEEILNAPRLKEVLRTKKIQEVYSEEGYEDLGYDHAGHERHAEHDEKYSSRDDAKFRIKQNPESENSDSANEETRDAPETRIKKEDFGESKEESNVEPKITRSRTETSSTSVQYTPSSKYKSSHKYSSKIKNKMKQDKKNAISATTEKTGPWVFPTVFEEIPPPASSENLFNNDFAPFTPKTIPKSYFPKSNNKTLKYKISTTTEKPRNVTIPYLKIVGIPEKPIGYSSKYRKANSSLPFSLAKNKTVKYQRLYSKSPKPAKIEAFKTKTENLVNENEEKEKEDKRDTKIVLPTIGYINSLTTAHFAKGDVHVKDKDEVKDEKGALTSSFDLTEALAYLRSGKKAVNEPATAVQENVETVLPEFEPMKIKISRHNTNSTKVKRDAEEEEGDEKDVQGETEHDEKNEQIRKEEEERIKQENIEKEKYEKELSEEISKQEEKILQDTFKNIGVNLGNLEDEKPTGSTEDLRKVVISTTPMSVDVDKYPFYFSKSIPKDSPLRYATNPRHFPRKSGHGMEFYESRDRLMECPDVDPKLDQIPKENSTEELEVQPGENQRIVGLGDKIACLKIKYFDEDPLDSPFFKEKEIDYAGKNKSNKKSKATQVVDDSKSASSEIKVKRKVNSTSESPKVINATEKIRYRSSYVYRPNKPLRIVVKDKPIKVGFKTKETTPLPDTPKAVNVTNSTVNVKDRIIPVKEQIDEPPYNYFIRTTSKIKGYVVSPNLVPDQKKTIKPKTKRPPIKTKIITSRNKIIIPYNCMHQISKMSALQNSDNVIVDCKDATLIQETRNGAKHVKIMPKFFRAKKKPRRVEKKAHQPKQTKMDRPASQQSDWIPMIFHPARKDPRFSRKSDTVDPIPNNATTVNESDHYIIDELKEEEIRKGEVVEDKAHFLQFMNETQAQETQPKNETEQSAREKRQTYEKGKKSQEKLVDDIKEKNSSQHLLDLGIHSPDELRMTMTSTSNVTTDVSETKKKSLPKRKLSRLSGKEFLVRYHKHKGKSDKQTIQQFWKMENATSTTEKSTEIEASTTDVIKREKGPVLYYVIDKNTGQGKWITNYNKRKIKKRKLIKPK